VLADGPPPGAVVVADHAEWLALTYLMDVWGASPAVTPQPLCRPLAGAETYITRRAVAADPACLAEGHRYAAGAELIRVQTEPERRLPATARPVDLSPGGGLHLIGYAAAESRPPVALRWRLSLYWQAAAPLDADYTVSVRPQRDGQPLSGLDGGPLIQDHQPAWNAYPTSRWRPGEVVRDDYVFDLPPGDARRPDAVQIVVYRALPGSQGGTTFETLGEIELGDIE
jgi:hypothetical protein